MSSRREYEFLYTEDGRPATKWWLVNLALIAYGLFCFGLVFYLAEHPLFSPPAESGSGAGSAMETETVTPDFSSFENVDERKQAFFDFLVPLIRQQNQSILRDRQRILAVRESVASQNRSPDSAVAYLADLAEKYDLDTEGMTVGEQIDRLLLRADKLPVSMVLAQAAMESAWGTSRFVEKGNNFFGEWCFKRGCGTVPLRREEGEYHEVASFDSARDSLGSYFRNINTHRAYRGVREIRASLRRAGGEIRGLQLIEGLHSYSEKGEDYIAELRAIIRGNGLMDLDQPARTAEAESDIAGGL